MHDYQRDQSIAVEADRLYAYLSDVANLPHYFARIRSAELVDDGEVHTRAVIEPKGRERHEVEGTAWFRRDSDARRIEWGSEGDNNYRGSLTVSPTTDDISRVVLEIHTESGHDGIEQGIDETLAALETAVLGDA